jgi:hypothetical protein
MSPVKMMEGVFEATFAFAGAVVVGAAATGVDGGGGAGGAASRAALGAIGSRGDGAAAPHAAVKSTMRTVGAMSFGDIRIQERAGSPPLTGLDAGCPAAG